MAPDCAWCDAANTLTKTYAEVGTTYYECSCCAKQTRIDGEGMAHRVERRRDPAIDVNGAIIDGP